MSEQSWWRRTIAAINREYDRRIRRASLVTEYGADRHGHAGADEADHPDEEAAEIVNVPKGTRIGRQTRPEPPSGSEHSPT